MFIFGCGSLVFVCRWTLSTINNGGLYNTLDDRHSKIPPTGFFPTIPSILNQGRAIHRVLKFKQTHTCSPLCYFICLEDTKYRISTHVRSKQLWKKRLACKRKEKLGPFYEVQRPTSPINKLKSNWVFFFLNSMFVWQCPSFRTSYTGTAV